MLRQRYILFKKIAHGGMAEVYLAKQTGEEDFQRVCCIKKILSQYSESEQFIQMFRDEAKMNKNLQHANIVKVEGFEEIEGSSAIIMEYVRGLDLNILLKSVRELDEFISIPFCIYIISQCARGLSFVHSLKDDLTGENLGIIHRDISPPNILLSFEGEVKITDFGIADSGNKDVVTKAGVVKGKYAYMSPEQIKAQELDARSDLFSLGVTLWEILANRRLFQGRNEVETIQLVSDCFLIPDIQSINSNVDSALKQILMKSIMKDPDLRYQTMEDFERDLVTYLNQHYPSFMPDDFAKYLQVKFAGRIKSSQEDIKNLLEQQAESEIKEELNKVTRPIKPNSLESSSKKIKAKDYGFKKFAPKNMRTNITFKPRSEIKKGVRKNVIVEKKDDSFYQVFSYGAIFILAALILLVTYNRSSYNDKFFSTIISSSPGFIKVKMDDKYLFNGNYVNTPFTLKNIQLGSHNFTFERKGYDNYSTVIRSNKAFTVVSRDIILRPQKKISPVKVFLKSKKYDSVKFSINDGIYIDYLKTNNSLNINYLLFGMQHKLVVVPNYPKAEESFSCSFSPRSNSWVQPFKIEINPDLRECSFPF